MAVRSLPREVRRESPPREEPAENAYYLAVSGRFRVAKYLFLLLIIAYLAVMLSVYKNAITYENLRFLLKDLDTSSGDLSGGFASVSYPEQQNMTFALFRGELAVAGSSRLSLFSSGGGAGPEYQLRYDKPVLLTSDKYLLCYDLGGRQYSLYTSLANVRSETTERDITGGAMGRDGSFALVTRSSTAKYQVTFWNASFRKLAVYFKDQYVFDTAVSDDGSRLLIVSADVTASAVNTEVMLCRADSETPVNTVRLEGAMPLRAAFFGDGRFCVLCDVGAYFFDAAGNRAATVPAGGLDLADFSSSGAVLVCGTNVVGSENTVTVLDTGGNLVRSSVVTARLKGVAAGAGDALCYLLTPTEIFRLQPDGSLAREDYTGSARMILAAEKYALLCRSVSAGAVLTQADG